MLLINHSSPSPRWRRGIKTPVASLLRHVPLQFVQPRAGRPVRRRTLITARRQRTTRADLRTIRHGRPLELAEAEEAPNEQSQPVPDLRQLVAPAALRRE